MNKHISIQTRINEVRKKNIPSLTYKEEIETLNKYYLIQQCENSELLISELKAKLSGYKQQDVKKKILDNKKFITLDETLEKLVISKLICKYCSMKINVFYQISKEPKQWTLDRIDNSLGHNDDNVVICCLGCNLKRRRLDHDKFLFSQKMKLVKIN